MSSKPKNFDTPVDRLLASAGEAAGHIRTALAAPLYGWRHGTAPGNAEDVSLLADACGCSRAVAMRAVLQTIREARASRPAKKSGCPPLEQDGTE